MTFKSSLIFMEERAVIHQINSEKKLLECNSFMPLISRHIHVVIFLVGILFSVKSFSSPEDSNAVISESKEQYEFLWKNSQDDAEVKQSVVTTYSCSLFGTTISRTEYYNNQATIDDIELAVDGKKRRDLKPRYAYDEDEEVFYSDDRVCSFSLPLESIGSTGTISFKKTFSNPLYFTNIYFSEKYLVLHKEVVIKVPRWMKVELKEMNFNGYTISKTFYYDRKNDTDVFTYTIANLPSMKQEENAPGPSYIYPHLLVLSKEANKGNTTKTYFKTIADQYKWYKQIVYDADDDAPAVKQKANEITAGLMNDLDKIKAVFYWVQNNIRYVAFEDGIAGLKPDKAGEVIRKKYGDCKGMANTTKKLLKSLGYDARLCWIGTNHIAYNYSTPSLSVDNHIICALKFQDKFYFLDATESYLGFNEYAERIQGRQCLVEDGENFILTNIPVTEYSQNLDQEKNVLTIDGTNLTGTATQEWQGQEKEYILVNLNNTKKDISTESFIRYLSRGKPNYIITDLTTSDVNDPDQKLTAAYRIHHKNAIALFDKECYIDLDFQKEFYNLTFDTTKRKADYWFTFKVNVNSETQLTIPSGYTVTSIPQKVEIIKPNYEFLLTYTFLNGVLTYNKKLIVKDIKLLRTHFAEWNNDIAKLRAGYNEQIILTVK